VPETRVRPALPALRPLLLSYALLGLAAGVSLFVDSGGTQRFAWTIKPPLTAAFLGAAYWASVPLNLLARRERVWARVRIAVVPGLLFTTLILIATLLHLDRFHLGSSPEASGRAVAWIWLVVYIVIPPLTLAAIVAQLRLPGGDPPREAQLHGWMRATLAAQAVVLLALGAGLFVAPSSTASLWPWTLTPLTARATAAWLCGIGLSAALAVRENDVPRVRPAFAAFAVAAGLEAIALARYPHTPDWNKPAAWLYVAFLLTMFVVAVPGLLAQRPASA
jgi:hypothetical protein